MKILEFLRRNLWLILIILLALGLRFYKIDVSPPSLNWDEVSHGYNAYSILKTGKDEWGISFPTIFRAYGDYKLPVYIYLTTLSEVFLGLMTLAIRLPSLIAGTLTVLTTYFLVRELVKNQKIALLASFLMAIEPWGLFVSRIGLEANVALFLIVSGIYFFVRSFQRPKLLIFSSILLGLSLWTYNSARVFVPIFVFFLTFIYLKEILLILKRNKKIFLASLIILFIFTAPMIFQFFDSSGLARYGWVKILDEGAIGRINEQRNLSSLPNPLPILFYNKVSYLISIVWSNYFTHFNPEFLYFKGGSHFQFSLPGFGLLYLGGLPFFLIGIVFLISKLKNEKYAQVFLSWLVVSPIASSLTREAPHVLRSLVMLPIPMIATSLGIFYLWHKIKEKPARILFLAIFIFVLGLGLENYLRNLWGEYRINYSWSWQYGYKEIVDYAKENYQKYDKIVITKKYGEPHEFVLFYWPWDPNAYRNDSNLIRFNQTNWYWVDAFDKFVFVNDWQIKEKEKLNQFVTESQYIVNCKNVKCLLITSPNNFPAGWKKIQTINFLDDKQAFEVYEN